MAVVFGLTFAPVQAVEEFPDVHSNYWSYDAIMFFKQHNVLAGYPDGLYRPDQRVTRAEFATIVTKALGLLNSKLRDINSITFTHYNDVDENFWAYYDVMLGSYYNIIHGRPDGNFDPNNHITRLEVIQAVMRALQTKGITEEEALEQLQVYRDANEVPYWALLTTGKAQQLGIIVVLPGKEEWLLPNQQATRGELAVWLYGMLQRAQIQANEKIEQAKPKTPQGPKKADGYIINNVIFDGDYAIIPAGTELPLGIMECLYTKSTRLTRESDATLAEVGTPFLARALVNFVSEDRTLLIPIGSEFTGKITKAKRGTTLIKNSELDFQTENWIDSDTRAPFTTFNSVAKMTPKVREFTHNPYLQAIGFHGFKGHNFYTHKSQQAMFTLLEEVRVNLKDNLHMAR